MKQGRSLMDLVSELERQRNMRKDYIADTRNLEISTDEGISTLTMFLDNTTESFKINETTHQQISSRCFWQVKNTQNGSQNIHRTLATI